MFVSFFMGPRVTLAFLSDESKGQKRVEVFQCESVPDIPDKPPQCMPLGKVGCTWGIGWHTFLLCLTSVEHVYALHWAPKLSRSWYLIRAFWGVRSLGVKNEGEMGKVQRWNEYVPNCRLPVVREGCHLRRNAHLTSWVLHYWGQLNLYGFGLWGK